MPQPLIIGHRGASSVAPENTLIAFEAAMTAGADGVEFDVRLARDGIPVVIHDATLRRTGLRNGSIANFTSTELSKIDVGSWFNGRFPTRANKEFANATVPSLSSVLDYFKNGDAVLYIEMKATGREYRALAKAVAGLIHDYKLSRRAVVESFALQAIGEIKGIDPSIRTVALFEPRLSRPLRLKRTLINAALVVRADEIALHKSLATARTIKEARRNGLRVVVWTVDHPSWMRRAISEGIHAIITNVPGRMCDARSILANL
jgi:glycerophosphoryl diester phosphodiesterase